MSFPRLQKQRVADDLGCQAEPGKTPPWLEHVGVVRRDRVARLTWHDDEARGIEIGEIEDHAEARAMAIEIGRRLALDEHAAAIHRIGAAILGAPSPPPTPPHDPT